jgi:hypothetical protein
MDRKQIEPATDASPTHGKDAMWECFQSKQGSDGHQQTNDDGGDEEERGGDEEGIEFVH